MHYFCTKLKKKFWQRSTAPSPDLTPTLPPPDSYQLSCGYCGQLLLNNSDKSCCLLVYLCAWHTNTLSVYVCPYVCLAYIQAAVGGTFGGFEQAWRTLVNCRPMVGCDQDTNQRASQRHSIHWQTSSVCLAASWRTA